MQGAGDNAMLEVGCSGFCLCPFYLAKNLFSLKMFSFLKEVVNEDKRKGLCVLGEVGEEGKIAEILCWNEGLKETRRDLTQPINFSTRTAPSSECACFLFQSLGAGVGGEAFRADMPAI